MDGLDSYQNPCFNPPRAIIFGRNKGGQPMNALSELNIQTILELLPAEPGVDGVPAEERFSRLHRFFAELKRIIVSPSCRMAVLPDKGSAGVWIYFNGGPNQFNPAYAFDETGAHRFLEGSDRQFVGSWKEGIRLIVCDLIGCEQAVVDAAAKNVQALSRVAMAFRPDPVPADRRSSRASGHPRSAMELDLSDAEWT